MVAGVARRKPVALPDRRLVGSDIQAAEVAGGHSRVAVAGHSPGIADRSLAVMDMALDVVGKLPVVVGIAAGGSREHYTGRAVALHNLPVPAVQVHSHLGRHKTYQWHLTTA